MKELVSENFTRHNPNPSVGNQEYHYSWEADEILILQQKMLLLALEEIRDRRKSAEMRLEAWNWLFSDNDELPFSARRCALNSGYDIDNIRYLIKRLVKDIA